MKYLCNESFPFALDMRIYAYICMCMRIYVCIGVYMRLYLYTCVLCMHVSTKDLPKSNPKQLKNIPKSTSKTSTSTNAKKCRFVSIWGAILESTNETKH